MGGVRMDSKKLRQLLKEVKDGKKTVTQAKRIIEQEIAISDALYFGCKY